MSRSSVNTLMPRGVYRHSKEQMEKLRISNIGKPNPMSGKHHSESMKEKNRLAHSGEKAYNWKGDDVSIRALHQWLWKRIIKPKLCSDCKTRPPRDLANITGVYNRDIKNWRWLCRTCHQIHDYRVLKVRKPRSGVNRIGYSCPKCELTETLDKKVHWRRFDGEALCNTCYRRLHNRRHHMKTKPRKD